ncbi:uncharacterized protein BX664DRAFT_385299 [Halteromyces radiatus]|uniref:uncharacterized protein n=1 Tax=Halteromyces radiatus TaxID=101107 RepID=UPI002220310E|nr:uncharacterized protein BX664DRAFT_385299 [Halteromyces radiatus]KAI8088680.1 hypothetical protein BX664DRAFT_385299 [Halteromyces radiatus]
MPRHSKNNTAGSVFTYHEAKALDYGTKRARLGRESFRDFDACYLCLQTAREPVTCSKGHLACRECYYESYLQQKQAIKREQVLLEQRLADLDDQKLKDDLAAKQALLDEFEKTQTSVLGRRNNGNMDTNSTSLEPGSPTVGSKRKLDTTETQDKKQTSKEKLKSSFWLPTMTPVADTQKKDEIKPIQTQPLCRATKDDHPLSMKGLIEIKFEKDKEGKSICPACLKTLSNSSKLSVMRNCGHVVCHSCVDMFIKKTKKCYVCEEKTKSKDIVNMTSEGTGYTSGSTMAMAERFDVAFQ